MWNDMSGRNLDDSADYETNLKKITWEYMEKETFLMHLRKVEQNSRLHFAIYHGNKPMIRKLLQFHTNIEIQNKFGNRALHIAAMRRRQGILQMVLDFKADVHARNNLGCTALYLAAKSQRRENVHLLLENGADVNVAGGKYNDTALHKAVRGEDKGIVLALLMYGADPETCNDLGHSSLFLAFSYPHGSLLEMIGSDQEILKLLTAFCVLWDIQGIKAACWSEGLANSLKPFTRECEEEVKRAKLFALENSGISYCDVLKYSVKEIALLLRKKRMKVILTSKLNLEIFPIYSEMFDFKIKAGLKCKYLVKQSSRCIQNLLKDRILLPDFIAENIISNLDIGDLKQLSY